MWRIYIIYVYAEFNDKIYIDIINVLYLSSNF